MRFFGRSLQRRLTIIFIIIVSLPLATAGLIVQYYVTGQLEGQAVRDLPAVLNGNVQHYNDQLQALPQLVSGAAGKPPLRRLLQHRERAALTRFLRKALRAAPGLGFLVATDRTGHVLAAAHTDPGFLAGFRPPGPRTLARPG